MNILLILLGCNISYLLNDRIQTAIQFADNISKNTNGTATLNWFLSGGIKNPNVDTMTEAEKMARDIAHHAFTKKEESSWNYIYDTIATNTAENFIMAKHHLDKPHVQYSEVYVVTSEFHHKRASQIANKILDKNVKWILGSAELEDSRYWENIHMRNVDADVHRALQEKRLLFN